MKENRVLLCPSCSVAMDMTPFAPDAVVACPRCGLHVRARARDEPAPPQPPVIQAANRMETGTVCPAVEQTGPSTDPKTARQPRVTLTKRELESDTGGELVASLGCFLDGRITRPELAELKETLQSLAHATSFPAIGFLLGEIAKAEAGGDLTVMARLELARTLEKVLPADERAAKEPWERGKPSPAQLERIEWWARQVNEPLPVVKTKGEASRVIALWLSDAPILEDRWHNERDRRRDTENELLGGIWCIEDWRKYDRCARVPENVALQVIKDIGWRAIDEPWDRVLDRFFAELRRQRPDLFHARPKKMTARKAKLGCGGFLSIIAGLLLAALFLRAVVSMAK